GGHRALAQPRGGGAPGRPRLRLAHGALARGAPEAQRGAARDARPGGTHPRRDSCGSVDPAGALEEAQPPKAPARRMTGFRELLERAWEKSDSLVCVGLDPEIERFAADAVTVTPYLGGDALEPFLRRADKGVIILCRTSNPGARELQDLVVGGRKVYQVVAELAARRWNSRGNCLLVVGATYPGDL